MKKCTAGALAALMVSRTRKFIALFCVAGAVLSAHQTFAQTVYVGNNLTLNPQVTYLPDGVAPLVILGEYNSSEPLAGASPATTLPTGTVQDVKFYADAGEKYSFTLYALQWLWTWNGEQCFEVMASQSFSGTASQAGVQKLAVQNFPVNSGFLLGFAGTGPVYPQTGNDAMNSDATYESSSSPGNYAATAPGGPTTTFTVATNASPDNSNYEYIPNTHQNRGRSYAIGVDVAPTQTVLYDSGAGFPTLNAAPTALAGQGAPAQGVWQCSDSYSPNAAYVVGAPWNNTVKLFGPWVNSAPGVDGSWSSFTLPLPNGSYNPLAQTPQIVTITADVCMNLGPSASRDGDIQGWVELNDQKGSSFGAMGVNSKGHAFGWIGAELITAPATCTNTYHVLRADLNFSTRQITYFLDGASFASGSLETYASTLVGSVGIGLQGGLNPMDSNFLIDNLKVVAHPALNNSCSIKITKAGASNEQGHWGDAPGVGTPGLPTVGENYGTYVNYTVTGTPNQPYYRLKYTLGNATYYSQWYPTQTGTFAYNFSWGLNVDGPMAWSVTIDPDSVTGSSTPANMTTNGTYVPTPPSQPVVLYDTVAMDAIEHGDLTLPAGSPDTDLWMLFGYPTSHGAQSIVSVTTPANTPIYYTPPYLAPVCFVNIGTTGAGTYGATISCIANVSSMKVNPDALRKTTWEQMSALPAGITQWVTTDDTGEANSAAVSAFVRQYLPADYKTTMTPYDTARALHRAVMRSVIWYYPPEYRDPVNVLATHHTDCGGFAALMTAALRNAGIPARCIPGFWSGDSWKNNSSWHVRAEFYLPSAGWLLADADLGGACDPTANYDPDFCFAPDGNDFIAMDVGAHNMSSPITGNFGGLQGPAGPAGLACDWNQYLQPLATLEDPQVSGNLFNLTVANMPWEGTVSILRASNPSQAPTAWPAIATEDATGNDWDFSCPVSGVDLFSVRQEP